MLEGESPRITGLTVGPISKPWREGFTLLEIMVVVVILAIAAAMVVPMMSSGAGTKVLAAAQMLAADLEYAKSMAISRGGRYRVAFDVGANAYQVEDPNGDVIDHPVIKGNSYVFDFDGSPLDGVHIESADFDGTTEVQFDSLGSPYNGGGAPLNSGVITLQAGAMTQTIRVEPVTGFITVDD
jgi:prepilin-type N-terminal cleavage/methylation domain-containing protein